jgi:hypothetical protein
MKAHPRARCTRWPAEQGYGREDCQVAQAGVSTEAIELVAPYRGSPAGLLLLRDGSMRRRENTTACIRTRMSRILCNGVAGLTVAVVCQVKAASGTDKPGGLLAFARLVSAASDGCNS